MRAQVANFYLFIFCKVSVKPLPLCIKRRQTHSACVEVKISRESSIRAQARFMESIKRS